MINVSVDQAALKRLQDALKEKSSRLPRELATAINATAKKCRLEASRLMNKQFKVPAKVMKAAMKNKSSANAKKLQAVVGLRDKFLLPLKHFGPTQIKRGVTYKLKPEMKGRSVLRDAFIIQTYGGRVYRRIGKERGPIKQVYASLGNVYEQLGVAAVVEKVAREQLPKQIDRRIAFLSKQTSGGLRGNQTKTGRGNQ